MSVYTVHEPPNGSGRRVDSAEALVFVREGFSWGAALAPPIWLAARGAWVALAAYVAAACALGGAFAALEVGAEWSTLIFLAAHIALGFEVGEIERWHLAQRGWREIGVVSGPSREECERRFFDGWLAQPDPAVS